MWIVICSLRINCVFVMTKKRRKITSGDDQVVGVIQLNLIVKKEYFIFSLCLAWLSSRSSSVVYWSSRWAELEFQLKVSFDSCRVLIAYLITGRAHWSTCTLSWSAQLENSSHSLSTRDSFTLSLRAPFFVLREPFLKSFLFFAGSNQ